MDNITNKKDEGILKPEDYDEIHPLFWDKIPEGKELHPDIQALTNLDEEGTPEDQAENWRDLGNKAFHKGPKLGGYEEAINNYTKAIELNINNPKTNSILYSNRAAVNLTLKNYAKVIEDCKKAIQLDDTNIKAYYRATKAYCGLEKYKDAYETCNAGLKKDPSNKALLTEKQQIEKKVQILKEKRAQKKKEKQERMEEFNQQKKVLEEAFEKKGIKMGRGIYNTQQQYESNIYLDENGNLHFPVLILYEEHNQSDFIKDFSEEHCFRDHLSYMFPPQTPFVEWDEERKYTLDNLEIYFEVGNVPPLKPMERKINKRWIKVKQTTPLKNILSHADYVVPQFPVFYVVASNSKFKEELLKREFT